MLAPHREKLISALGGFIAILLVWDASRAAVGEGGAPFIVASMGASAVLLFAVPHGLLSQPWPVLGGHLLSALIGVSCYYGLGENVWAGALAVGLSIGVMYALRCIHPPGGATALGAVAGGEAIHELGYMYILEPILLNVLIILTIAFLFNYLFPWRRYPLALQPAPAQPKHPAPADLQAEDLHYAVEHFGSFLDVAESDLRAVYALARAHAQSAAPPPLEVRAGGYYSNGRYGEHWEIREVLEIPGPDDTRGLLGYRVVVGRARHGTRRCSREAFAAWAKYEVCRDENTWRRRDAEREPC